MEIDHGDEPDLTMLGRRGAREVLVSAQTALELARRVHSDYYGANELVANEPLTVSELGNNWIVRGAKRAGRFESGHVPDGPLVMKISKTDAQILSYRFEIEFGCGR